MGPVLAPREPRVSHALADIVGLDEVKAVLHEAVVQTSRMVDAQVQLFQQSNMHSAVLIIGPWGLGKSAAVEAAAAAAGALVLSVSSTDVTGGFCKAVVGLGVHTSLVVIIEALEANPSASLVVSLCLQEVQTAGLITKLLFVAISSRALNFFDATVRAPFGYVVELGPPVFGDRKEFLLRLLFQVSRVNRQWESLVSEMVIGSLANQTEGYTFAEVELVVKRAFLRSVGSDGAYHSFGLDQFTQILADTPPRATAAFNEAPLKPRHSLETENCCFQLEAIKKLTSNADLWQ